MNAFIEVRSINTLLDHLVEQRFVLLNAFGAGCDLCLSPLGQARISQAYGGRIGLLNVDVDEVPEVDAELGIDVIPTLLLFDHVKVASRLRLLPDRDASRVLSWLGGELRDGLPPEPPAAAARQHAAGHSRRPARRIT